MKRDQRPSHFFVSFLLKLHCKLNKSSLVEVWGPLGKAGIGPLTAKNLTLFKSILSKSYSQIRPEPTESDEVYIQFYVQHHQQAQALRADFMCAKLSIKFLFSSKIYVQMLFMHGKH